MLVTKVYTFIQEWEECVTCGWLYWLLQNRYLRYRIGIYLT